MNQVAHVNTNPITCSKAKSTTTFFNKTSKQAYLFAKTSKDLRQVPTIYHLSLLRGQGL